MKSSFYQIPYLWKVCRPPHALSTKDQSCISLAEVTDGQVVRAGVSVTWTVLSWSGGHEFDPRAGRTWGAWYFCPKSYLNQHNILQEDNFDIVYSNVNGYTCVFLLNNKLHVRICFSKAPLILGSHLLCIDILHVIGISMIQERKISTVIFVKVKLAIRRMTIS